MYMVVYIVVIYVGGQCWWVWGQRVDFCHRRCKYLLQVVHMNINPNDSFSKCTKQNSHHSPLFPNGLLSQSRKTRATVRFWPQLTSTWNTLPVPHPPRSTWRWRWNRCRLKWWRPPSSCPCPVSLSVRGRPREWCVSEPHYLVTGW